MGRTLAPSRGDIRTIYVDPLTETKAEGLATLVRKVTELKSPGQEFWKVRFPGDRRLFLRAVKIVY